jgi:signal transduction histidine kinase
VAATYWLAGSLWIVLSDTGLARLEPTGEAFLRIGTIKGLAFVLGSSILIYFLVRAPLRKLVASFAALEESEARFRELNAELERRVAGRTRDLEISNRELEAFSYSVSHDLRAPLRAIDGFSGALAEDSGDRLDETGRGHLQRIRAATLRMGMLIDDLLELARISRAEVRPRPVDLSAMAAAIVAELRQAEPERQVLVTIEPGLSVRGDERLVRVALRNLIGNAWKFTGRTEPAVILLGQGGIPGEFLIRDNGVGFDPAHAGNLFRPFQRLHGEHEFPGTGVGLAIVESVMARHGGWIRGDAAPGRGAVFRFHLPPGEGDTP